MEGKVRLMVLVLLCFAVCNSSRSPREKGLRLIQFNETYTQWMTAGQVDKLAQECGEGHHGGFFDITDHPYLSPEGLKVKVPHDFPTELKFEDYVLPIFPKISVQNLIDLNNGLTSYHTRYYTTQTGRQSAEWIASKFQEYSRGRSDVSVELFQHSWLQPSVIARITGRIRPDIIIVIGAHEDSINGGGVNRAPGADDDASGVCTILEAFRQLIDAGYVPEATIEFMTYSAEEIGLRGSQDIADAYQAEGKQVFAAMQFDMTFFNPTSGRGGIITDYVDPELTAFLRMLVAGYSTIPFINTACGYACSDHASWNRAGYAACHPSESPFNEINRALHTTRDTIDILDLVRGSEYVKIAIGFAVELGGIFSA